MQFAEDDCQAHEFLHLLGPAFPSLRSLQLNDAGLGKGSLFASLRSCPHFVELHLLGCTVEESDVGVVAALLGSLPSLQHFDLDAITPVEVASCLTTLTLFDYEQLHGDREDDDDDPQDQFQPYAAVAAGNVNLQTLELHLPVSVTAGDLQQVLSSCRSLRTLHLRAAIQQDALQVLLKHGAHLEDVAVRSLEAEHSMVRQPCRWTCLELYSDVFPNVLTLAHLSFQGLESLSMPGGPGCLSLPLTTVPTEQVPALVRKAAATIASTRSWQQQQQQKQQQQQLQLPQQRVERGVCLECSCDLDGPVQPEFTGSTACELLMALEPLRSPATDRFSLDGFQGCEFVMGSPEVAALRLGLGSSLKRLRLGVRGRVTLSPSFWPSLAQELPGLEQLWLGPCVSGATTQGDLALFCRGAPAPFTLYLDDKVCDEPHRQQLRSTLAAWGAQHVEVCMYSISDWFT
jgi:hypothetical protein